MCTPVSSPRPANGHAPFYHTQRGRCADLKLSSLVPLIGIHIEVLKRRLVLIMRDIGAQHSKTLSTHCSTTALHRAAPAPRLPQPTRPNNMETISHIFYKIGPAVPSEKSDLCSRVLASYPYAHPLHYVRVLS